MRAAVSVLAVALGLVSCSTVLGIDPDRSIGTDSASVTTADWSCLSTPPETVDPNEQVDLTLVVMDATQPSTAAGAVDGGSDLDTVSGAWLGGVTIRDCALRDVDCQSDTVSSVVTDATGHATFHLGQDFMGFFDMRGSDLVPSTLYPGRLLTGQAIASIPAYAITPAELGDLTSGITSTGADLDPNGAVGHAVVTIYDCQDHQAPGATVSFNTTGPNTVPFYFQDGLPSRTATKTDGFGLAGALNVPVGSVSATAELPATHTAIGMATFSVRPGALTFAWIRARTR